MSETTPISQRIHGIDLARALAIIGMVYAHIGPATGSTLADIGETLTRGFASATFAVLAGVSLSIMARDGAAKNLHRLMVRGVILMAIGCFLQFAQDAIAVVLVAIGIIFVILPPVTRWRSRLVTTLFFALVFIGPGVQVLQTWKNSFVDVLGTPYPAFAWLTYGTLGILIQRRVVPSAVWQWLSLVVGGAIAAAGVYLRRPFAEDFQLGELATAFLSPEPHFGGLVDVLASCGAASAAIAACLLIVRVCNRPLYPLRALGAMSLTFYVCHVLTAGPLIDREQAAVNTQSEAAYTMPDPLETRWPEYQDVVRRSKTFSEFTVAEQEFYDRVFAEQAPASGEDPASEPDHMPMFLTTLAAGLLVAPLWMWFFRRGPLEWVMFLLIERAVRDPKHARTAPESDTIAT